MQLANGLSQYRTTVAMTISVNTLVMVAAQKVTEKTKLSVNKQQSELTLARTLSS